ncbi:MAG: TIGR01777 family oxidoreductase [Kiritimatiellae bacterium]|nr:TIGR01777 family oxidoreductase [Kiritimatiellia bacterium]
MTIAITGSHGLIGSALWAALEAEGVRPVRMVRSGAGPGEVQWNPTATGDLSGLAGCEAVVHLAGANIAAGRWTTARKALLRSSRVDATRHLACSLARLSPPPRTLVCASAIGWYPVDDGGPYEESAPAAPTFLGELVRDWEAAAEPAAAAGMRVVQLRFGVVLSPKGGALARMLPLFRLGLGGPIGSGRQWMSWVSLDDAVRAIRFVIAKEGLRGPVNVTAPHPVMQREFAAALGRALRRPAVLPTPAWALRLVLGEMADALLLRGSRVLPRRLLEAGFQFAHPALRHALAALLS